MIRLGILNLSRIGLQHAIKSPNQPMIVKTLNLTAKPTVIECQRTTTFFNKLNAEAIWKSVNTVSNAGKRRGRAKSLKKRRTVSLNTGQQIGVGKENIKWPGLNCRIIQGQDVIEMEKLPPDPDYEKNLIAARDKVQKKEKEKIHPLERGWTSKSILGKSLGPPDVIEHREGFDSYVLEMKLLNLTDGKLGKVRSFSAFAVVGNKNGLIGIASAKAAEMKVAVRKAQRKASKQLFYIKLDDGHTVNHDFFYQFGITKLFVYKKPPGYGLECHRGIAVCCKLIGISDIYVKIEGSRNKKNVIKAFLLGLLEQKTYQQIADENKLHLVEQREETYNFPVIKASPSEILPEKDENMLFSQYIMGGKLPLKRQKKPVTGYLPGFARFLKRTHYQRNHEEVKLKLMAEYGEWKSYLTEIYPECKAPHLLRKADKTKD